MLDIFVGRQPIFDRDDRLVAYELLYRGNPLDNAATGVSTAWMSAATITRTLLSMGGVERVADGKLAFVNVDRTVLLDGTTSVLDPARVVVEILETVACDPETHAACTELVTRGYTLALDDFVYSPSYDPLLRLAKIVKVDVLDRSEAELRTVMAQLRPFGVRCLAERVENAEVHRMCAGMGFELFQGYFYARPEIISGREVPVQQAAILSLLNLLRNPDVSDAAVEDAFRGDMVLTYKLLRIVNSASVGGAGVDSIKHAVRLLGRQALHRWLSLLLVSSYATGSGVQSELVTSAMVRARLCELVAERLGRKREGGALFMAGLFSLLDALMRMPMSEILERVDLAPELRRALLERDGPYAPALKLAEAYETACWDEVFTTAKALQLPLDEVPALYGQAADWVRAQSVEMQAA